jgi:hypothetical protein
MTPAEYANRSKEDQNLNRAILNYRTQWGAGHQAFHITPKSILVPAKRRSKPT